MDILLWAGSPLLEVSWKEELACVQEAASGPSFHLPRRSLEHRLNKAGQGGAELKVNLLSSSSRFSRKTGLLESVSFSF